MTYQAARIHQLHTGPIKGLAVTAALTATGSADGTVRVLDANGEHHGTSSAHRDVVNAVAIAADHGIVSASRDRTIRLFDRSVGRSYVIGEHDHWVMDVACADDGQGIVSASEDATVGIWQTEGASVKRVPLGRPANAVDWRRDVIAAVGGDGVLHLLSPDGSVIRRVHGPAGILWDVALSPDATRVAWVGRDGVLRIAPIAAGEPLLVTAHREQIWGVAWNEDGTRIVTTGADGAFTVWSADGSALQRVAVGPWLRAGAFRGSELLLAAESGHLHVYADDGLDPHPPAALEPRTRPDTCTHWEPKVLDAGRRPRCAECGSPEEARLCVTCGHVGCCESQLAHATKHWVETGHPNTIPVPAGELAWRWCYADDMYVERT